MCLLELDSLFVNFSRWRLFHNNLLLCAFKNPIVCLRILRFSSLLIDNLHHEWPWVVVLSLTYSSHLLSATSFIPTIRWNRLLRCISTASCRDWTFWKPHDNFLLALWIAKRIHHILTLREASLKAIFSRYRGLWGIEQLTLHYLVHIVCFHVVLNLTISRPLFKSHLLCKLIGIDELNWLLLELLSVELIRIVWLADSRRRVLLVGCLVCLMISLLSYHFNVLCKIGRSILQVRKRLYLHALLVTIHLLHIHMLN